MHIVMLVATQRGKRVLEKLFDLKPEAEVSVFSFSEDPWEPPFLDEIQALTLDHGGRFFAARQVGGDSFDFFWRNANIDIAFAVNWRYMVPKRVYTQPRLGTFVFHDSILPAYRGFSPTVWAMINGENQTGVSLFEIAEEVDSGDIIDQEIVGIGPDDTICKIMEQLTEAYILVLERSLARLLDGSASRTPQDHSLATYTCKRTPEDNQILWTMGTNEIYNLIRAVSRPYPGAFTFLRGKKIRIWSAQPVSIPNYVGRVPGRVIQIIPDEGVVILTGDGALLIKEVQINGEDVTCATRAIRSLSLALGTKS